MQDVSRLTFRITLWRPWLLAVTLLGLLAAVGIVVSIVTGERAAAVVALLGFAAIAVVLLLPISVVAWMSRWHVDSNGIGGRNNMLVYNYLSWADIVSVEPWLIPGYPYVQVNGTGKRWAFWLPLFLTDMSRFRAAVAQYAPPENPLRRYLEQHTAA